MPRRIGLLTRLGSWLATLARSSLAVCQADWYRALSDSIVLVYEEKTKSQDLVCRALIGIAT